MGNCVVAQHYSVRRTKLQDVSWWQVLRSKTNSFSQLDIKSGRNTIFNILEVRAHRDRNDSHRT